MYPVDELKSPARFDTINLNAPPHHRPMRRQDSHDEDGSITDVEDEDDQVRLSLVEEGDYMHSRSRGNGDGFLAAMKEHRWLIDTGLLFMILFLLFFRQPGKDHFWEGTGDMTGFAPEFSQKIVSFTPDMAFVPENATEFFTDATKNKWLDMVPAGLGYVNVVDANNYDNLPTKLNDYPDEEYVLTTAVTHQMHCLHAIAEAYSGLRIFAATGINSPKAKPLDDDTIWHVSHCFDYLRQSLMCCGDVALEGQQTTFPGDPKKSGSDGFDAKHVCKDYNQVFEHLKISAVDRERWI